MTLLRRAQVTLGMASAAGRVVGVGNSACQEHPYTFGCR
jgi:hypothetical protein